MQYIGFAAQIIVALGIFNVWLLRFNRSTGYRGGDAQNMREEFAAYGLPAWFMYTIGALKLAFAVALLAGFWISELIVPAGVGMAALMLGAVAMHLKVGDPPKRAAPAAAMLILSLAAAFL
ncbi:MAG: DoxX family protein [Planctomycetota bacterium]